MSAAPAPATVPEVTPQETPAAPAVPKIYAGNLAFAVTEEGLKEFFAPIAGDITSVQIIQHNHRSAGYGFVSVSNPAAIDKAVEVLNGKELNGRAVNVAKAKDTEVKDKERSERKPKKRVGRRNGKAVPGEVTDAEANGEAEKSEATPAAPAAEGEAKPKKAKKARKPKKKTPATTETPAAEGDASAAAPATTEAGEATPAAPKKAKRVRTPRAPRVEGEGEPSKSIVFVANLQFNVDDAALAELFTSVGLTVVSARVIRRRFGQPRRSKGFGFVDVGSEEQQKKAVELLDDKEIGGRKIVVKVALSAPHLDSLEGDDSTAAAAAPTTEEAARAASPETTVLAK